MKAREGRTGGTSSRGPGGPRSPCCLSTWPKGETVTDPGWALAPACLGCSIYRPGGWRRVWIKLQLESKWQAGPRRPHTDLPTCPPPSDQAADKTALRLVGQELAQTTGSGPLWVFVWALPLPSKVMTRAVFLAGSHVGPTGRPVHSCPLLLAFRQATNGGQSRHRWLYSLFCEGSRPPTLRLKWLGQLISMKGSE